MSLFKFAGMASLSFSGGAGVAAAGGAGVSAGSAGICGGALVAIASAGVIQTILAGFAFEAARFQRTRANRIATCATAMIVTLRQKRASRGIGYFVSAFVAIPTLLICARCNASINEIG